MKQKKLIIVTGPTASGKTSLAIQLAEHFDTEIISADSRQCYRELNIGVAKPSPHELALVKHHFINSHSIHDSVNAATFSVYAQKVIDEIFRKKDVAIMAGGTGLYIKAFVHGLDEIPEVPENIRAEIRSNYETRGMEWLREQVQLQDPLFYNSGEIQNPQRMMRALEVRLATGMSIKEFHKAGDVDDHPFSIDKFAIHLKREQLYENINSRVDKMVEQGLEAEARSLLPLRHLNALQTVGYSEMFDYFDGTFTLPHAVDKIKQHTRHYAKRQLTWLRNDCTTKWVTGVHEILSALRSGNKA